MIRQPRLPILLALACALFLRALVPAGWMPTGGGGTFAVEPCPAAQSQPMVHMSGSDMPADHGSSHKQHPGGDACFSALLVGFAPVDQPELLQVRSVRAVAPAGFSAALAPATGPPSPPPPSTGPPAIA